MNITPQPQSIPTRPNNKPKKSSKPFKPNKRSTSITLNDYTDDYVDAIEPLNFSSNLIKLILPLTPHKVHLRKQLNYVTKSPITTYVSTPPSLKIELELGNDEDFIYQTCYPKLYYDKLRRFKSLDSDFYKCRDPEWIKVDVLKVHSK